ncbi:MAG: 16S rRNA (adenine(1518)-N(6)/adenine(1519)-N(6))-dimethyltransferase RsmA [Cytophagales bacterium]
MKQNQSKKYGYVRAKKSLGQHFLKDEFVAEKIANELQYDTPKTVIEIGPGMGVLTKYIVDKISNPDLKLKLIELDRESVEYLRTKEIYQKENIEIVSEDVLKLDWQKFSKPTELIGNLPYNISSPIFFKIIENYTLIYKGVFMVQKEVADRICSKHGSKTYGILSVLLQSLYSCTPILDVAPNSFIPPPKVNSSVFKMELKKDAIDKKLMSILKPLVKKSFNNRRKMMRNTIGIELNSLGKEFEKYLTLRPEQISVSEFIFIAKAIADKAG